jgi:hypothetical protein
VWPISATPFFTVSGTFSALPSAPPGNTCTFMRPADICSRRSAKSFAPTSMSGPLAQPVAIFQLYVGPACACAAAGTASAAAAAPPFRKSRFFMSPPPL